MSKEYKNIILDFHGVACCTYAKQNQVIVKIISKKNKNITFKDTWKKAYQFLRYKKGREYLEEICKMYGVPLTEDFRSLIKFDNSIYKVISKKTSEFIIKNKHRIFLTTFSSENVISQIKKNNPFLDTHSISIIGNQGFENKNEMLLHVLDKHNINNKNTVIVEDRDISQYQSLNADIFEYDYPVSINNIIYKKICNKTKYIK